MILPSLVAQAPRDGSHRIAEPVLAKWETLFNRGHSEA